MMDIPQMECADTVYSGLHRRSINSYSRLKKSLTEIFRVNLNIGEGESWLILEIVSIRLFRFRYILKIKDGF